MAFLYLADSWPGGTNNPDADKLLRPEPVQFTSPLFLDNQGNLRNYNRVAFEADIPAITPNPPCHHRINAGVGCTNPRQEPSFIPFTAPPSFCLAFAAGRRAVGISKALSTILAAPQLRSMARCCSVLTSTGLPLLFWPKTTVKSSVKIHVNLA